MSKPVLKKIAVILAVSLVIGVIVFLMAIEAAYADPDVSKWSCHRDDIQKNFDYGIELVLCGVSGSGNFYVRVSGELIYVHEHITKDNKTVYYNALKVGDRWFEVVNRNDLFFESEEVSDIGILISIIDDEGEIVAKRAFPLLNK